MPIAYTSKEPLEAKIARLRTLRDAIANHEQAIEVLQADLEREQASCTHDLIEDVDGSKRCAICGADLTTDISLGKIKVLG